MRDIIELYYGVLYADETKAAYLGSDKEKNGLSAINNYYRYLLNNAKRLVVVIASAFASAVTHTRTNTRTRTRAHYRICNLTSGSSK